MQKKLISTLVTASILLAGSCSSPDGAKPAPTSSTLSTPTSSSSSSNAPDKPSPTLATKETTPEYPQPQEHPYEQAATTQPDAPVGYTEAPGQVAPHPLDKTIAACGDALMHQTGTTFFTDGTSGWTQQCADTMMAQQPAPAPAPSQPELEG